MAVYLDREHYIPLRVTDLVDFLCDGKGARSDPQPLDRGDDRDFRRFALAVSQYFHLRLNTQLQRMKDAYAPFDPDVETISIVEFDDAERKQRMEQLFNDLRALLEEANYVHLNRAEIQKIMEGASAWGLEMDVCWEVFERLELFYRGDMVGKRIRKRWWKLWKKEELDVPEFNRLMLVLKQQPHKRLGKDADYRNVFIKLFKDMPKKDLEMILPGTRVRLTRLDKGMIFYPLVMGFAILVYSVLTQVFHIQNFLAKFFGSVALTWSLAAGFAGYAYRSYYTYTVKKTAYSLQLTESLYYQGLDNNGGVFYRLIDEAEEQETREVLVAYFYLWKRCESGMTATELDDVIEKDFEKRLGLKFDTEIMDAITKLEKLDLVSRLEDRYVAVPILDAIDALKRNTLAATEAALTSSDLARPRPDTTAETEQKMMSSIQLERR